MSETDFDVTAVIEGERRHMAHLIQDTIISPLDLLLAQTNAYEASMRGDPQSRLAFSVLMTMIRQTLQQARDLEAGLRPTLLDSLGLEPALETLASQEMRARGVQVTLSFQRLGKRLSPQMELALFRAAQDAIDRAARQGNASHVVVQLEKTEEALHFRVDDNGLPPTDDVLRTTQQHIHRIGGQATLQRSALGGLALHLWFTLQAPIDLTEREWEVLQLVAEGHSNKRIADKLVISPRTVKFHLDNVYAKLGVNTRTEAAIWALRRGSIDRQPPDTP